MNRKAEYFLGMITLFLIVGYILGNILFGVNCKINSSFSEDKYCSKNYGSNASNLYTDMFPDYQVRSHSQDLMEEEQRRLAKEEQARINAENLDCYNSGYDINRSFDILKDYGYTKKKLEYINDHFVDKVDQKDGGYIKGDSSGFGFGLGPFGVAIGHSSGSVEGKFYEYVVTKVSATGQLVQNIQYHVDCKDNKHNEVVDYYSEAEFVMYYVNHFIDEEKE